MALPDKIVTNDDIASMVDTSDEWIRQRTGIRERRVAGEGETTLTLGLPKAKMNGNIKDLWLADIGIPREVYVLMGLDVPSMFRESDHYKLERSSLW